uniref:Uncharacterized protein n=2 Tax=Babesia bovis TaxID=5865 RepID=A7AWN4_BABBO|eukprot:XP_001609030.1 hypothetical protein [Babesia bovis T2Bo]
MDAMLASYSNSNIFGGDMTPSLAKNRAPGLLSQSSFNSKDEDHSNSRQKHSAFLMESFRLDHTSMKPLNSANIRNIGGFTGFHNLESALKDGRKQ